MILLCWSSKQHIALHLQCIFMIISVFVAYFIGLWINCAVNMYTWLSEVWDDLRIGRVYMLSFHIYTQTYTASKHECVLKCDDVCSIWKNPTNLINWMACECYIHTLHSILCFGEIESHVWDRERENGRAIDIHTFYTYIYIS